MRALEVLGETLVEFRHAPDPRLLLDVALVRLTRADADTSAAALLARIEKLERALAEGQSPAASASAPGPSGAASPTPTSPALTSAAGGRAAIGARAGRSTPASPPRPAAAAPLAPAPSAAPTASTDAPSRDQLTLVWADQILPSLKGMARALFSQGRFVEPDPGSLAARFAVPATHPLDRLEQHRGDVEAILSAHFHRTVTIVLTVDHGDAATPVATGSPAGPAPTTVVDDAFGDVDDLDGLVDAPPGQLPPSGLERLTQAFPGAELLGEES